MPIKRWIQKLFTPRPQPADPSKELGRNDPCWCGSGKKYKRCHLSKDAAKRMEAVYAAQIAARNKGPDGITGRAAAKPRRPPQAQELKGKER